MSLPFESIQLQFCARGRDVLSFPHHHKQAFVSVAIKFFPEIFLGEFYLNLPLWLPPYIRWTKGEVESRKDKPMRGNLDCPVLSPLPHRCKHLSMLPLSFCKKIPLHLLLHLLPWLPTYKSAGKRRCGKSQGEALLGECGCSQFSSLSFFSYSDG